LSLQNIFTIKRVKIKSGLLLIYREISGGRLLFFEGRKKT
jgi:hypothetical protein